MGVFQSRDWPPEAIFLGEADFVIIMASKITYWKCVDCNSMIDDKNMREVRYSPRGTSAVYPRYMEFCGICCIYNPEVVIAYD